MRSSRVVGLAALPLAAAVLLGPLACSDDEPQPAASVSDSSTTTTTAPTTTMAPQPVDGLMATVGTNRLYQPRRELGLAVRNAGEQPVVVIGLQLVSDLFEPVEPTSRRVVLPAGGRRLVLPLPYGVARCDGDLEPRFSATIALEDGRELRVPAPEDRPGTIGRLHERECAAADVRDRVSVTFGDRWTRDGVAVSGTLTVRRRLGGPPVVMDDIVGNVIFTLRPESPTTPVLQVTDERPEATVDVTISADRCDSHAVAEFKRPFVFLSWFRVGGGDATPVELEPTGPARAALEDVLASC